MMLIKVCEGFSALGLDLMCVGSPWINKGSNKQTDPKLLNEFKNMLLLVCCQDWRSGTGLSWNSICFDKSPLSRRGAVLAGAGEHALHENTTVNFQNYHLKLKDILMTFKLWTEVILLTVLLITCTLTLSFLWFSELAGLTAPIWQRENRTSPAC